MAKRIALKDNITVDAVDLSNFARSRRVQLRARTGRRVRVQPPPARTSTWPAKPSSQSPSSSTAATAATEVHADPVPDPPDREVVAFAWRPDQTAAVSATNPQLRRQRPAAHLQPVRHPRRSGSVGGHVHRRRRGRARLPHHLDADNWIVVERSPSPTTAATMFDLTAASSPPASGAGSNATPAGYLPLTSTRASTGSTPS